MVAAFSLQTGSVLTDFPVDCSLKLNQDRSNVKSEDLLKN